MRIGNLIDPFVVASVVLLVLPAVGFAQDREQLLGGKPELHLESVHPSSVFGLELGARKQILLSHGVQGKIALWKVGNWNQPTATFESENKKMILKAIFSKDMKRVYATVDPNKVVVLSLPDLEMVHSVEIPFRPGRLAELPEKNWLAVGGNGEPKLINLDTGKIVGRIPGHKLQANGICFIPESNHVFVIGDEGEGEFTLRKWAVEKGGESEKLVDLPSRPMRMRATKDGKQLLITTDDTAIVYDIDQGKITDEWFGTKDRYFQDLNYWAGRDVFLTCSRTGMVEFWKSGNDQPLGGSKVTRFDVYNAVPVNRNLVLICTRTREKAIALWRLNQKAFQLVVGADNGLSKEGNTETPRKDGFRHWLSADGQFKIEARLQSHSHGIVTLIRKHDGKAIQLRDAQLSEKDRASLEK